MDEFYANIGYFLLRNFSLASAFVFCSITAVTFFTLIPTAFNTYRSWKATHKPANLSMSIVLGAFSIMLLATIYPLFVSEILKISDLIGRGIYRMGIFFGLFSFVLFFLIPRSIYYYMKLTKTMSVRHFSVMCFLSFVSFCVLSMLFIPIIYSTFSVAR